MYDVPPSPGLTSAANIRINKIKNNKLTFFLKKWFQNSRSKFCEVASASSAPRQPRLSPVSYTTYSDMCKSTNTSRSLLPLWDSRVLTSNNQVKWVDKWTLPRANDALWDTETNWTDSEGTASHSQILIFRTHLYKKIRLRKRNLPPQPFEDWFW